jgi:hypothetical protein
MSANFDRCLKAFVNGWISAEALKVWVTAKRITQEEYDIIVATKLEV